MGLSNSSIPKYQNCRDRFWKKKEAETENRLGVIMLHNGEKLFFNSHLANQRVLRDVFWYISEDQICHIEEVLYSDSNTGTVLHGVDYFIRDISGRFIKADKELISQLPQLHIANQQLRIATSSLKELSISDLLRLCECYGSSKTERATDAKIALYGKILNPFLPLFAVAISAILSISFERKRSTIFPFIGSIGFLFIVHVILQSTNILARGIFIPSTIALLLPWIGLSYGIIRRLNYVLTK